MTLIGEFAVLMKAAAKVNHDLGPLAKVKMDAIAGAVTEFHAGKYKTSSIPVLAIFLLFYSVSKNYLDVKFNYLNVVAQVFKKPLIHIAN